MKSFVSKILLPLASALLISPLLSLAQSPHNPTAATVQPQPEWIDQLEPCRDSFPTHFKNQDDKQDKTRRSPYRFFNDRGDRIGGLEPDLDRANFLTGIDLHEPSQVREALLQPYKNFNAQLKKSVNGAEHPKTKVLGRKGCYKDWTILVAMDGANDLHPYALWDLFEMEAGYQNPGNAASTIRSDLIAQVDLEGQNGVRRIHLFETNKEKPNQETGHGREFFEKVSLTQIFTGLDPNGNSVDPQGNLVSKNSLQSPLVDILDEDTFSSKKEWFTNFIKWGIREYPAKNYMVVLWGHGKGWLTSEDNGVHLNSAELTSALSEIHSDPDGLQGKKKIDVFTNDACFMMGIEVASEIAPYTRFIAGSAQIQHFLGLPYRTIIRGMHNGFDSISDEYPYFNEYYANQKIDKFGYPIRPLARAAYKIYDHIKYNLPAEANIKRRFRLKPEDQGYLMARALPTNLAKSLHANGYQGRIDKEAISENPNLGREYLTYASIDTRFLDPTTLEERGATREGHFLMLLENFAVEATRALKKDSKIARKLRSKVREQSKSRFETDYKTFEFGLFVSMIQKEAADQENGLIKDAKVARTAKALLTHMQDHLIIKQRHGTQYPSEEGFMSLGFWLPSTPTIFKSEKSNFINGTLFTYQSKQYAASAGHPHSAWAEFMDTFFKGSMNPFAR